MQIPRVHVDRLDEKAGVGLAGLVSSHKVWGGWVPICSPFENPCPKMAFLQDRESEPSHLHVSVVCGERGAGDEKRSRE